MKRIEKQTAACPSKSNHHMPAAMYLCFFQIVKITVQSHSQQSPSTHTHITHIAYSLIYNHTVQFC